MEIKDLLIIISVVLAVFAVLVLLLPYLKKKGFDVDKTMELVSSGLDAADKVVDSLQTFVPNTSYLPLIDKIIEYCQRGYQYAEQLNAIGKIEKGQAKKDAATKYVYDALKLAGINTEDEKLKSIIDGSIEAAVYASKASAAPIEKNIE